MRLNHALVGFLCFFIFNTFCFYGQNEENRDVKIAFLSDIHLQDIYANFSETDFKGILNPVTGKYNTVRTMEAQLHSTRLFNENYFALKAALEIVVQKGIKIVALPGDYTDDGQPMNVRALRKILDSYAKKHGITFLITTGNHDPVGPFALPAGKTDFLGEKGQEQPIFSTRHLFTNVGASDAKTIITPDIQKWGYQEILSELSNFGFFPNKKYLFWQTPFSNSSPEDYSYDNAIKNAAIEMRTYPIGNENIQIPDASYLVEPVKDLWVLALDGNVYLPKQETTATKNSNTTFSGASDGYKNVMTHKRHLIEWVAKVSHEAEKRNKILIAFSHYPMIDFNDGATPEMKALFGENNFQLHRVPPLEVAESFANAGLKLHFGGHMHINDTNLFTSSKGNTLINIQVPSLAAYLPAFKIATIKNNQEVDIETIVLENIPNFKELFPLYQLEHQYLQKNDNTKIWDNSILNSTSYKSYTEWHLKELVRLRFLPEDWPESYAKMLQKASGKDLLFWNMDKKNRKIAKKNLAQNGLKLSDFKRWNGLNMIYDFYRLRSADGLAFKDVGTSKLNQYILVCENLIVGGDEKMKLWGQIFTRTINGLPSNNFKLNLKESTIEKIE